MSTLRARACQTNGGLSHHDVTHVGDCCNGNDHSHTHSTPGASDLRNPRRVKKVKNTAFSTFYGPDWEAQLQIFLLLALLFMAGFYGSWRWMGTIDVSSSSRMRFFIPKPSYHIPGSMKRIGDKSVQYQLLRQLYDAMLPKDDQRSLEFTKALHKNQYKPAQIPPEAYYDVHQCPFDPPEGYPFAWNILDVLNNWPPDDTRPHLNIYQGLCVFDYETDYDKAMNYRDNELPFLVRGDPAVAAAVERWNSPGYMEQLMNTVPHRAEYSQSNHFLYWMKPTEPKQRQHKHNKHKEKSIWGPILNIEKPTNWSEPTKMLRMKYIDWLRHANVTDDELGPDKPHWYYRLIGCGDLGECDQGSSEYLFDELTFFQPRKNQLYLVDHEQQKGIHCRFGMKGVIAENHFDGSRNAIVVLGGERRYILSHPEQCELLALLPKEHPSGRHSAVDWSNPDLDTYPQFAHAKANEVILQAGDVLYLPTNWFHYIISLDLNFQCNTRSGVSQEYMPPIHECGF